MLKWFSTESAVVKLWKNDEWRIVVEINVLQDEDFCLKLKINAVLEVLVWWRVVFRMVPRVSSSEEFRQDVLVSGICCFGMYNWRLVTLESLNILVVKVLVFSVCALYKFYVYVHLNTVICFSFYVSVFQFKWLKF